MTPRRVSNVNETTPYRYKAVTTCFSYILGDGANLLTRGEGVKNGIRNSLREKNIF